jgi:hypothetical protein
MGRDCIPDGFLNLPFSGSLIDLGCGPLYQGLHMPMVRHDLRIKGTSIIPEVSSSTSLEGNPLELSDPPVFHVSKIVVLVNAYLPSEYVEILNEKNDELVKEAMIERFNSEGAKWCTFDTSAPEAVDLDEGSRSD